MRFTRGFILVSFISDCQGQCPPALPGSTKGILDGLEIARRLRIESARTAAEIERMRAETHLIEEQTKTLREETRASQAIRPETAGNQELWNSAIERVAKQYPDFHRCDSEIARLAAAFTPGNVKMDEYLEGMYLTAKFASFSGSPMNRGGIVRQLAAGDATREPTDPVFQIK
jgi:hypothetical protein